MKYNNDGGEWNMVLEVGDEFRAECVDVGKKGDGVFKKYNMVVFVKGAEKGNVYDLKIVKVLHNYAYAEIVD